MMMKQNLKLNTMIAVILGLALSAPALAGKGPRAGIKAQTTCALTGTSLNVTVDITNSKTTGPDAIVDSYSVTPVYKNLASKGNTVTPIDSMATGSDANTHVGNGISISKSFNMCDAILGLPTDLRSLNADVSISFGMDDGLGGVSDVRTVINSCSDDPATEAVEPAGIKINYDELATACAAQ